MATSKQLKTSNISMMMTKERKKEIERRAAQRGLSLTAYMLIVEEESSMKKISPSLERRVSILESIILKK